MIWAMAGGLAGRAGGRAWPTPPGGCSQLGIGASWFVLLEAASSCADDLGGIELPSILVRLLEDALTGGDSFECAHSSDTPYASWFLSFIFVLLTVVLLLNMLIAMCDT